MLMEKLHSCFAYILFYWFLFCLMEYFLKVDYFTDNAFWGKQKTIQLPTNSTISINLRFLGSLYLFTTSNNECCKKKNTKYKAL